MIKWQPESSPGKVIVWAEQGIGDEVMFMQFFSFLESLNFEFTVECDERLHEIVKHNFQFLKVIGRKKILLENYKYHVPIGDLFSIYYKDMEQVRRPALIAQESVLVNSTISQYNKKKSFVGISWKSLSKDYTTQRTVSIDRICEGLDPKSTTVVVLQPKVEQDEIKRIEKLGFDVISNFDCHNDINSVFALISHCKEVISIANSVAHFSGALNKPTTLLLPRVPSWRWGVDLSTSYWYPSVNIKKI